MRETTSVVIAFIVMSVVSGVLFAVFSWMIDYAEVQTAGYVVAMLGIGVYFSAIAALLLGLPTFILLRRFRLVRWWVGCITGFVIGALIGVGLAWPGLGHYPSTMRIHNVVRDFIVMGVIGAISALAFWMIWKNGYRIGTRRGKQSQRIT